MVSLVLKLKLCICSFSVLFNKVFCQCSPIFFATYAASSLGSESCILAIGFAGSELAELGAGVQRRSEKSPRILGSYPTILPFSSTLDPPSLFHAVNLPLCAQVEQNAQRKGDFAAVE